MYNYCLRDLWLFDFFLVNLTKITYNIFNKKSREEHQRNYENAKNQVNEFEQTVADLKKQIDDNEKLRDESKIAMDAYKSAWENLMINLKNAVQDSIVYSKDLQESLEKQKKELENVKQETDA